MAFDTVLTMSDLLWLLAPLAPVLAWWTLFIYVLAPTLEYLDRRSSLRYSEGRV